MNRPNTPSRRTLLQSAALAATVACLRPAGAANPPELLGPATLPSGPDRLRGLKVGVASYSFRKLPLDATIKAIQRVALRYVSIKDFHLPLKSTAEERKAVAGKFRDAGITPLSCGVVALPDDETVCRNAFQYAKDIAVPVIVCHPEPPALPMLEKLVKEFDVRLAIHNHGPEDKKFPSPYDALKAIEKLDPRIGLCIERRPHRPGQGRPGQGDPRRRPAAVRRPLQGHHRPRR